MVGLGLRWGRRRLNFRHGLYLLVALLLEGTRNNLVSFIFLFILVIVVDFDNGLEKIFHVEAVHGVVLLD